MTASIAVSPRPAMVPGGLGYRLWFGNALPFLVAKLFTGRVRVTGGDLVPTTGPVLFVGRHCAGLMDGWLYAHAVPRPTVFVIAARLRRNRLLRPLVAGIAVMRRKDGGDRTAAKHAALQACRSELAAGRTLFIFPEGTSSLGESPLPLEPGAALLARAVPGTALVPVAIHYADPVRLGTNVAITFGAPHYLAPSSTVEQAQAHLAAILGSVPQGSAGPASVGSAADAPVRWLATLAGRRLADDDTAVLTWGTMIGLPLQVLCSVGLSAACLLAGQGWLAAVYGAWLAARLLRPTERVRA
jgi:1-acyl-sn-glycerol-3-phosphate acyltransferase